MGSWRPLPSTTTWRGTRWSRPVRQPGSSTAASLLPSRTAASCGRYGFAAGRCCCSCYSLFLPKLPLPLLLPTSISASTLCPCPLPHSPALAANPTFRSALAPLHTFPLHLPPNPEHASPRGSPASSLCFAITFSFWARRRRAHCWLSARPCRAVPFQPTVQPLLLRPTPLLGGSFPVYMFLPLRSQRESHLAPAMHDPYGEAWRCWRTTFLYSSFDYESRFLPATR